LAGKYNVKSHIFTNPNIKRTIIRASLFFEESLLSQDESLKKNIGYLKAFVSFDLEMMKSLLKDLNLTKVLKTKFSNCSTGEKKKFLIVLNLSQSNRNVFFLDEPFENTDMKSTENLCIILKLLFSEKNTLFVSSHQPQILKDIPHEIIDFTAE
jgi:ABC-type multidrug transport system ATPase subunit